MKETEFIDQKDLASFPDFCRLEKIAQHHGMTEDELVRLKQIVGIAKIFATPKYSKSWGDVNEVAIR